MPLSTLTRVKREVIHMGDLLVVRAKIKEAVKECNVAGDFAEALDKKVRELIKAAEWAMLGAIRDDPPGECGPHLRQPLQFCGTRRIDVNSARGIECGVP